MAGIDYFLDHLRLFFYFGTNIVSNSVVTTGSRLPPRSLVGTEPI